MLILINETKVSKMRKKSQKRYIFDSGADVKVRISPTKIIAGMFGFEQKEMFKAEVETEKVPEVKFG